MMLKCKTFQRELSLVLSSRRANKRSLIRATPKKKIHLRAFSTKDSSSSRTPGILMNPDSASASILPNNRIEKVNPTTGETRFVQTERELGHWWMMTDLTKCHNKPILSNDELISSQEARILPTLSNLSLLSDNNQGDIQVPDYFTTQNRARDETAQCTLLAIAFKQYGSQLLPSWTDKFEQAFPNSTRAQIIRLSIVEGGAFRKWLLRGILTRAMKKSTPPQHHDSSLVYFGTCEAFKDSLRMHNTLTSYVYLLDGIGRVRFAGSGEASVQEQERLVQFAKELVPKLANPNDERAEREKRKQRQRYPRINQ